MTFAEDMKRRLVLAGMSVRALALAIPVNPSYLAKIARGERHPPPDLAATIDRHLDAGGELAALAGRGQPAACPSGHRPLNGDDVERIRGTITNLVRLDTAHGSEGLHQVAERAFYAEQNRAATAGIVPAVTSDVQSAIAELGEVAAWLAYDAEAQPASRRIATEALLLARLAGDRAMERFILSHLAMQAVYVDRPAEALCIADRVIAEGPVSKRVVAMFRVRRARALGGLGVEAEAVADVRRARSDLGDGTRQVDPEWTWWLHEAELAVHEGRLRSAVGDARSAVEWSHRAVEALPERQGRDGLLYRAWLLRDLVDAHAWRDAEQTATDLVGRAGTAGTARVPRILRGAASVVDNPGTRAPRRVRDAVRAALEATENDHR